MDDLSDIASAPRREPVDRPEEGPGRPRTSLDLLKTLGDNTRYAIYLEIARSASPRSTSDIADALDLHPNTVRPHLERMREVGVLEVHTTATGSVGRPQNRYALAADAPSLGLEPPLFPMLAGMLLTLAAEAGVEGDEATEVGRLQGRQDARRCAAGSACVEALVARLGELGFDPELVTDEESATIGFAHCPFASLAEANPEVICGIHRGLVEGFVDEHGGASVDEFRTLVDRHPCQVDVRPVPAGVR